MTNMSLFLPNYQAFTETITPLSLSFSGSELHGVMCGYICAGANRQGEDYLRALMTHQRDEAGRAAILALFDVYAITQHQIEDMSFSLELMLPDDEDPLRERAQAFSEWCMGFTEGLAMAGVDYEQLQEKEAQDALLHIMEFSNLDSDSLDMEENDEKALMEVTEYTRVAIVHIHTDLQENFMKDDGSQRSH